MIIQHTFEGPRALVTRFEKQTILNSRSAHIIHIGFPNDGEHMWMVESISPADVARIIQDVIDGEIRLDA